MLRPRLEGDEPDPRFSLANERTFLAWTRTSLALIAGGLGLISLLPPLLFPGAREALGLALVALGVLTAGTSYRRWRVTERAMRTGEPLPISPLTPILTAGVALVGTATAVLLIASG